MTRSVRGRMRSLTLRTQLIIGVVALMALLSGVIGGVSLFALDRFQIHQLDGQLSAASTHNYISRNGQPPGSYQAQTPPAASTRDTDDHGSPGLGLADGAVTLHVDSSGTSDSAADVGHIIKPGTNALTALTAAQRTALASAPANGHPKTITLPGLGDYRVLVTGDPGGEDITGLPLSGAHHTLILLALVISVAIFGGLLLAGVLAAGIVSRALRPLRRVAHTADLVSTMQLHKGEVEIPVRVDDADTDRRTEVGQVGAALNQLLGHVTSALQARHNSEERVRQFVADASHELRTPLAAIRGYAELTRPSRKDAPPDLAHAMERVESQAIRMSSLVEDLLLLARLDSGRPLEREEVDLSLMLIEAIGDAHAAGPDHRWDLELPEEPVVVAGDGPRLHQVVVNLLANARTHTPPGTHVTMTLDVEGDAAVVTVVDNGPGVPDSVLPDIFERFTRADTSRSRTAGSTGLGLSIVAAVVNAHRGQIWVDSVPGHTCFTVRLPLADQPAVAPEPANA